MNSQGQLLAWFGLVMFLVVAYSVGVSYLAPDTLAVGNSSFNLMHTVDRMEWEIFQNETALKVVAYEVLRDQANNGGFFEGCTPVEGVTLAEGACAFTREALLKAFTEELKKRSSFGEQLQVLDEKTALRIDIPMTAKEISEGEVHLKRERRISFLIEWAFEDYQDAGESVQDKFACMRDTPFDILFDVEDKIVDACGFSERWKVTKRGDYAFFTYSGRKMLFIGEPELKFAQHIPGSVRVVYS